MVTRSCVISKSEHGRAFICAYFDKGTKSKNPRKNYIKGPSEFRKIPSDHWNMLELKEVAKLIRFNFEV